MEIEEILNASKEEIAKTLSPYFGDEEGEKLLFELNDYLEKMRRGLNYCLSKRPIALDKEAAAALRQLLEKPGELAKEVEKGKTLQSLLNISNEELEEFYQTSLKLFGEKDPLLLESVFLFLITLNPLLYPFWLGLAAAKADQNNPEEAERLYKIACKIGFSSPEPSFYFAEYLRGQGKREEAHDLYKETVKKAADKPEFLSLESEARSRLR